MQVLFGQVFTDEKDKEILVEKNPFTLRDATKQALLSIFQDEQGLTGDEKVKRYDLYLKVKDTVDPAELTAEDISLIKKLIGKAYGVLIVGQAFKMLESGK